MRLTSFGLTAALLSMVAATPALAQERDSRRREAARAEQNAQRQAPQREAARSNGDQPRAAEQPRRAEQARPRQETPRAQTPVQPSIQVTPTPAPAVTPRVETRGNNVVGRAVPRTSPSYNDRYYGDHNDGRYYGDRNDRRYYGHDNRYYNYAPRYYAPHAYIARPYVFRPHVSIGFGIFAGYPVPYAWTYSAPVYVYGYRAPRAPVYIAPGAPLYGGVALEISPYDADVFVDGNYAGKVADFDGTVQPLTVVPGTHRIEVQAPGYAPLIFDVTVQGGQVVPYRGDLRPF